MKIKITFYTLFFVLIFQFLNAQKSYYPGYITTNDGNTISGYIEYRNEIFNSQNCLFTKSRDVEPINFTPDKIRAYKVNNRLFKPYLLPDMENQKLFLEYLVEGNLNLLFYIDESTNAEKFYIQKEKGELTLLEVVVTENKVFKNGQTEVVSSVSNKYKTDLMKYFTGIPNLTKKIENLQLERNQLIEIVKSYNKIGTYEPVVDEKEEEKIYIDRYNYKINFVAGASMSKYNFRTVDDYLSGVLLQNFTSVTPAFGITMERKIEKFGHNTAFKMRLLFANFHS